MYPSGQVDPDASYSERISSTNSPSYEEDEDVDGSESDTSGDLHSEENIESPIRSVIGPDGLRNFILPLMWTINSFNSTIQRKRDIRFSSTSPSVCFLSLKSVITMVLMTLGCTSKCSRQDLDCL